MEHLIRAAEPDDAEAIIGLMKEFATYENLEQYCTVTANRLRAAMFGDGAVAEGLIAIDGASPVGYAIFYPNFSSFRGQMGLYLEDIYIREQHRRSGLGEAMLREIARLALTRGFERIDFMVLDWNTSAIRFYEKLGAVRDPDERHFKFTDDAFRSLL